MAQKLLWANGSNWQLLYYGLYQPLTSLSFERWIIFIATPWTECLCQSSSILFAGTMLCVSISSFQSLFQMLQPSLSRWEAACDLRVEKRNKQGDFMAINTGCCCPSKTIGKTTTHVTNILIYRWTLNDLMFGRGKVGCTRVGSEVFARLWCWRPFRNSLQILEIIFLWKHNTKSGGIWLYLGD